ALSPHPPRAPGATAAAPPTGPEGRRGVARIAPLADNHFVHSATRQSQRSGQNLKSQKAEQCNAHKYKPLKAPAAVTICFQPWLIVTLKRDFAKSPLPAPAGCFNLLNSIVAPDRFRNGPVSVPFHQAKQTLIDPLHGAGPLVNKARVNLHRAGAGFDFLIGVFGAKDSSDSDDRQLSINRTIEMAHEGSRQGP